jgi:transcriptional regulator with XRE-family HTH domain
MSSISDEAQVDLHEDGRLALHVRRNRTWYRDAPLEQAELALLAGISGRQVRSYECAKRLPAAIDTLLAMAIALEVKIEDLIAPHIIEELVRQVEARRAALHGANSQLSSDRIVA